MQNSLIILRQPALGFTLRRLCQEILENHPDPESTVLLGLQPRGVFLAERLQHILQTEFDVSIKLGKLDATFYRDDFRKGNILQPNQTNIQFVIEGKSVILIDDVIATGRMVRAAIDAMQAFGRPAKVELLCLINRKFNRDLPIQPDYCGKKVNTLDSQKVKVDWTEQGATEDLIWLME